MTIVDLFAGPGGWSTGLNMIGRAETVGIEWDKAACDTGRAAGHERLQADIAELDPHTIGGSDVEGLIASPPCQGFSMAGKGRGREDSALIIAAAADMASGLDPRATLASKVKDDRSVLALEPLRWALDLEPEWTTWEQVPAVLPLWEACAEVLRADGYSVWTGLVQAEQYGVPQTRKRAILTATRNGQADRPTPTHSKFYSRNPQKLDEGLQKWVSMAEALGWGMTHRPSMTVTGGGTGKGGAEPFGNGARQGMFREMESGRWQFAGAEAASQFTAGQIPRDLDQPAHTITGKGTGAWVYRSSKMANSARRQLDQPAPTIAFGHDSASAGWVYEGGAAEDIIGPFGALEPKNVRVTVEEAAVLQSFPADYPWQGTKTAQYRQVGDAVPPLLAAHILSSVGVGYLNATEAVVA